MKNLIYLLTFISIIVLCQACDDGLEFEGSDEITTEFRDLSAFNEIEVKGVIKTQVIYSEESMLEISTNENIHERILSEVNDNRLELRLVEGQYDNIKINAIIYTNDLSLFIHNGVGEHSISDFPKLDNLEIRQSGVGNITVSGSANRFEFEGNDVGNFYGFDFIIDDCEIDQSGVGNVEVNCQTNLTGSLTGVGNLYYKGFPEIDVDITGVGKLIDAN